MKKLILCVSYYNYTEDVGDPLLPNAGLELKGKENIMLDCMADDSRLPKKYNFLFENGGGVARALAQLKGYDFGALNMTYSVNIDDDICGTIDSFIGF